MASPSCRQDGDIPSARSAECPGDGRRPVVTEGRLHLLPSGLSIRTRCLEGQPVIHRAGTPTREQWETIPIGKSKGCWDIHPTVW